MDVIMHQQNDIKNTSSQLSFWVFKNKAFLALQAASLLLFVFILLSLRMDFSAFSISFFTFNLGRTHMFILCNGIVAILVKGSVLSDPHDDEVKEMKNVEVIQKVDEISAEKSVETENLVVVIEQEEEVVSGSVLNGETEQFVEDESQEEEDEVEELSVEELNKKCDEFIRRMRGVISNGL